MNIAYIFETALIIAAAFLVGAIIGYFVRCWFFKPEKPASVSKAATSTPAAPKASPAPAPASAPSPAPAPAAKAATQTPAKPVAEKPAQKPAEKPDEKPAPSAAPAASAQDSSGDGEGKPAGLDAPRGGKKDDLKRIKGIGPKIEGTLNDLGIYHFDQIAQWNEKTVDWVNGFLSFKGRIQRESWIEQARALADGGETEFSKRVDKGEVASSKK